MTARAAGKASWNVESDDNQSSVETKIDAATKTSIKRFQLLIQILVNTGDTKRLLALQAVTQELYRRADECLSQGKTMTIADDVDPGWN